MRKVTSIARNIHIIGRSESSAGPTGIFTRSGTFSPGGILTREASKDAVLAAPTRTASSCAYRPVLEVYARPAGPRAAACRPRTKAAGPRRQRHRGHAGLGAIVHRDRNGQRPSLRRDEQARPGRRARSRHPDSFTPGHDGIGIASAFGYLTIAGSYRGDVNRGRPPGSTGRHGQETSGIAALQARARSGRISPLATGRSAPSIDTRLSSTASSKLDISKPVHGAPSRRPAPGYAENRITLSDRTGREERAKSRRSVLKQSFQDGPLGPGCHRQCRQFARASPERQTIAISRVMAAAPLR